jgi:hypothetical protein
MEELLKTSIMLILAFNLMLSLANWALSVFTPTYFVQGRNLLVAEAAFCAHGSKNT